MQKVKVELSLSIDDYNLLEQLKRKLGNVNVTYTDEQILMQGVFFLMDYWDTDPVVIKEIKP